MPPCCVQTGAESGVVLLPANDGMTNFPSRIHKLDDSFGLGAQMRTLRAHPGRRKRTASVLAFAVMADFFPNDIP
jgi:hypothetical protein